ncbi:MAG: ATP-binding protein [Armatimonadota bacterium]|nr:ATP-binding protein [Armatimonadota bacterium]MDR7423301.1 ATP-binding protein [Armatimonadota bacterium]MDR7453821.1 ATP-binding protein [Armatimonadota bacterium]MDR7457904.1 ATP-binding protein [Armatimonadota bacterium]MDR7495912.1 ATP-binding protein [Armatimonadota bacterium]
MREPTVTETGQRPSAQRVFTAAEPRDGAAALQERTSAFVARMTHELRTPLNAILGFAQILELDALTRDQAESVQQILRAGNHLLTLINEVHDFSRIEAGRLPLSKEPTPVDEVAFECMELIGPLATPRDLKLGCTIPQGAPWHVMADRQRLKQVLLNLLNNAVKYNRPGGSVTLSAEETAERTLVLRVIDTGAGIPADKLARLFTPFDRLGAEQSDVEGSGMGLALSKRLVEVMGGEIGVESTLGEGSTFWVELPLVEGQVQRYVQVQRKALSPPRHPELDKARTILYIEDNLSNLEVVQRLLAPRVRVRLVTAMQGQLGLELAAEHYPDLVLLDLHLPDIAGEEVLRRLKEAPETRDVPVVIISAETRRSEMERVMAMGAFAYLTKPLNVRVLLKVMDDALRR